MSKLAQVRFPAHQWDDPEKAPDSFEEEAPIHFNGEYRGSQQGRLHVYLDPPLDRAFIDKNAKIFIPQAFNKEYRGVYVGVDDVGNSVFDQINRVGGGSLSIE